jgi:hypothetical protein
LATASLAACGGTRRRPPAAPASASPDADLGLDELRADLESTVLENYIQMSLGNVEAAAEALAPDQEIVLIGPEVPDIFVGRADELVGVDRRLYRQRNPHILSKNLDVHLAQDGSAGWIFDEISYRVPYMGREASIPIRVTGIYVRDVERWVLVAEHASYPLPVEELVRLSLTGDLKKGTMLHNDYGPSRKQAGTLVGIIGRYLNGQLEEGAIMDDPGTLTLLPDPEGEYHGNEAVSAPSLASLFGPTASVAVRRFRVYMRSSKRVAWVHANLAVRTESAGDPVEVSLRGTFVFERRGVDPWVLVQSHISAPLLESQISERVFGPVDE